MRIGRRYHRGMPLKINFKSVLMYALYAAATVFINFAMPDAPLSLGLAFAMLLCGTNIVAVPVIFILASAVSLNLTSGILAVFEAAFLSVIVFLYRRYQRKIKAEAVVYLIIALAPYVLFSPWRGFGAASGINLYIMKSIAAAVTMIFTFFCFKSVYALIFKIYRCRLREDEFVCIAVVYAAIGFGLYTVAGKAFYIICSAAAIAYFTRLTRSPVSVIIALALAIPHALAALDPSPLTAYVIISAAALVFLNAGRAAPSAIAGTLAAAYAYYEKCFECAVALIVVYAVLLFAACAATALPSSAGLKEIKLRLECERIADGTQADRARRRTGERLYRISELFREIECAFMALDEGVDEKAAKERMFMELKGRCCTGCERAKRCQKTGVYPGFERLIATGCMKGRVNLIDLPSEITSACIKPSEVMTELNGILAEYRRCALESENARSGRRLLADQAHGVAEVMKDCAVELSHTHGQDVEGEKALKEALAAHGFACPEVMTDDLYGEIMLTVCGNFNVNNICEIIKKTRGRKYILKEKLAYDGVNTCLVFTTPPRLDAAFGVAYAVKKGERVSGDTHSVIRINEHAFLMALSDGMGSGEYARKVSEAAISLIEAFYRAEMPEDTVLKTINKLLSFNRDERFTCIDIAAVNLDSGRADFVKIGSPAGIIMRAGEIKVLESASLPLGILDNLKPTCSTEMLKSGDIITFMSDGVSSCFSSATELYEFLQGLKPLNPQNLADKILAKALDLAGHVATDDMTVVCTRLFEA